MSPTTYTSHYGSDQNGVILAYSFLPDQPGKAIDSAYVCDFLQQSDCSQEFLWVHLALSNTSSIPWLKENLTLPESFLDCLGSEISQSRIEKEDNALVLLIHDVLFGTTFDASSVGTAALFINSRVLISARLRPLHSIETLRSAVRSGYIFHSTVELLAHLLRDQSIVLSNILHRFTIRVNYIEDRLLANLSAASRSELSSLRRTIVRFQRLLAPEPAAFFRLLNRPPDWITANDLQDLQHAAEEFSACISDAIALAERIKLVQEELSDITNEQTNRSLFILTLVTVIALPINIVAGLMGMNVGGVPLANEPNGFQLVVGGLSVFTLITTYLAYMFGRVKA